MLSVISSQSSYCEISVVYFLNIPIRVSERENASFIRYLSSCLNRSFLSLRFVVQVFDCRLRDCSERTDNEVIERSDMVYGFPVRLLVVDEECSFRCEIICRHSYTSFSIAANAQLIQKSIRSERKICSTMKQINP